MSNFVIPELLGGGKLVMIGNLVRDQFYEARNWPFGATLALVLTIILVVLVLAQTLITRRLNEVNAVADTIHETGRRATRDQPGAEPRARGESRAASWCRCGSVMCSSTSRSSSS